MTGPFTVEEDGNALWVMDANGFCIARLLLRNETMPNHIHEFSGDDVRRQAAFIVEAMNALWEKRSAQAEKRSAQADALEAKILSTQRAERFSWST